MKKLNCLKFFCLLMVTILTLLIIPNININIEIQSAPKPKPKTLTKENINDEDVLSWYSLDIYTGSKKLLYKYDETKYAEFGGGHSCMRVIMALANINIITGTDFDMYFSRDEISDLRRSCIAIAAMATGETGVEFNFNNVSVEKNINTYLMNTQKLVLQKKTTELNNRIKNFFNNVKIDGISYGDNILVDFMIREIAKTNCNDTGISTTVAKENGKIEDRLNQALQKIYDFAHPKKTPTPTIQPTLKIYNNKTGTYKVTASDFLAIRSSDSTSAKKIGEIPSGKEFIITKLNTDNSWGYTTYNGVSGWVCLIQYAQYINDNTVPKEVQHILMDKETTVEANKEVSISYAINPESATDKTLSWDSSDKTIATVTNGVVTGVSVGTVTITATAKNGVKAECIVKVIESTTSLPNTSNFKTGLVYANFNSIWYSTNTYNSELKGNGYRINGFEKPQCTWYVLGRILETTGVRLFFNSRADGGKWVTTVNSSAEKVNINENKVVRNGITNVTTTSDYNKIKPKSAASFMYYNEAYGEYFGHIVFIEEVIIENSIIYVYYSDGNTGGANGVIKKKTLVEFRDMYNGRKAEIINGKIQPIFRGYVQF